MTRNEHILMGAFFCCYCLALAALVVSEHWQQKNKFTFFPIAGPAYERATGMPPLQFRGDVTVTVSFLSDVSQHCSENAYACANRSHVYMQNPCVSDQYNQIVFDFDKRVQTMLNNYRDAMCHEIGHVNGWSGDHRIGIAEIDGLEQQAIIRALCRHGTFMRDTALYSRFASEPEARLLNQASLQALIDKGAVERVVWRGSVNYRAIADYCGRDT